MVKVGQGNNSNVVIKVNFAELVLETAQRSCAAMKNSTENELIEVYVI